MDDFSSGRLTMLKKFPDLFEEAFFFGRGYYYLESFPLSTIIQVGVIGSTILFSFVFWVFKVIKSKFTYNYKFDLSLTILFYAYLFNSLVEEQAPFGPGAKCFLFWLPFGFVLFKRTHFALSFKLK
jgi:hypothetical protein